MVPRHGPRSPKVADAAVNALGRLGDSAALAELSRPATRTAHGGLGSRGTASGWTDRDIETYRSVWRGEIPPGCDSPVVPASTREVLLLFGGMAQASFDRVARAGRGYIGPSAPPVVVGPAFERARAAWKDSGRAGTYLVALAYVALGDEDIGRANAHDYYRPAGPDGARAKVAEVSGGADAVRATVRAFAQLGADGLMLNPTVDDLDQVARLADLVL
ncbi:LLM class flavin-dependent oxidoreductase [Streptomyces sp. NPDC051286]|uniref:LLM class flavin-dependent oxidoreductase n=1 Tax=Streptomyces sp. NPDC051286 TaxID=3365647 RepID=UPI0037A8B097